MQGEVTILKDGEKLMSMALSQSETQTMFVASPDYTGDAI